MQKLFKTLCMVVCAALCVVPHSFAVMLTDTVAVNQTSDTAAKAKINAMNIARRQALSNVLSRYAAKDELNDLLQKTSSDELANLISSTSVANEQMSSDGYSANITMNIDNDAVKKWLDDNGVQNWVPALVSDEKFTAFIVVPNGIVDWAELKRIARAENVEIETQSMNGNQILAKMPANYRTKFTMHIRDAGWKYADNGGILQVWK